MSRICTDNPFRFDPLEARRLLAADTWGDAEQLIRLPEAIEAFAQTTPLTGAGQTIAVIDSGIDYNHPALGGGYGPAFKVVGGYDFVDNDDDPYDTYGHGTEVAGIIAADQYEAGERIHRGIAPDAQIVALRIDGDGKSTVPDSRIEQALQWVIDNGPAYGVSVVNISYGSGSYDEPTFSTVYGDEIQTLVDSGVTVVAASGNGGYAIAPGIDLPAADPNVISVAAVDRTDRISEFSERGTLLDMLAPGDFVYTTYRFGGYGPVGGTSFASPYVAGTVALMKSIDPTLKPADVQSILTASGTLNFDGDTESEPNSRLTFPRLDVLAAVQLTNARLPASPAEQALFGEYGNGNAMAVDRFGITHLAYYDSLANTMRYSTRSVDGIWSKLQTIDDETSFQGYYLSMAVDKWGRPSIAYFDGAMGDLKYAHFDGIRWQREVIDAKNSVGLYPSLTFDRNELPVISYYRKTTGDLRVAHRDDTGKWQIQEVDATGDVGREGSIAIDSLGRLGIAYADSTSGHLKFAIKPEDGNWEKLVIDNTTSRVSFLSLKFDWNNAPVISYYDSGPADLKVARFVGPKWATDRIATQGAVGLYSNVFFDGDGNTRVIFFDRRQSGVFLAQGEIGNWNISKLADGGKYLSCAHDTAAGVCRFSYQDEALGKLVVGEVGL